MRIAWPLALGIPEPAAVREQLERVVASAIFSASPVQQRLLRFLVEGTLSDLGESLKEYTIGQGVFHRGSDFDPQTDSIVRVQVSVLRKKLAAYYQGEGIDDAILIDIPRGHYEPSFTSRCAPWAEPKPVQPQAPVSRWMYLGSGVLLGLFLAYGALRWLPDRSAKLSAKATSARTQSAAAQYRDHPLWQGFLDSGSNTILVVGSPLMVDFGGGFYARDVTVNETKDLPGSQRIRDLENHTGTRGSPAELYTGLGEAAGISMLTRFYGAAGQSLPLIRNRLVKWQDFATGNIIILSSLRFRTFLQEIEKPSEFEFSISGASSALLNLRPSKGEPAAYVSKAEIDYALVTVWPGTLPGRRIMAIGGSHTWGTEGAVEYITDHESLHQLRAKLEDISIHGAPSVSLQIVIQVHVRDSQVVSAEYVTHRWLR